MKTIAAIAAALLAFAGGPALAQKSEKPKFSADVPPSITTPDLVWTRIGPLKFKDGAPDPRTVGLVFDQLDLSRGIEAFMQGVPATSVYAACHGISEVGVKENQAFGITEDLMDARSLFLTPNTTTVYVFTCLNLNAGPVVLEAPPGVLGPVDDAYFRWVTDIGLTGPDQGKGGKYLFVPPGYSGDLPSEGYYIAKPSTNRLVIFFRAFVENGDIAAAVKGVKAGARLYPLSAAQNPPETAFVNTSGKRFNTISANNFDFYHELDAAVQNEPADSFAETVGLFASIGIRKGQPFAPDARMKGILTERSRSETERRARSSGRRAICGRVSIPIASGRPPSSATAISSRTAPSDCSMRARCFSITRPASRRRWPTPNRGRARPTRPRCSIPRAPARRRKTYKVTLPGPVPAKQFWSFTAYDNQTRSLLETDQKTAGIDSHATGLKANPDGSYTVWFAPSAPKGEENNWVQTRPGKGFNVLLRLYAPLEPWFDKSWKPGDFERVD